MSASDQNQFDVANFQIFHEGGTVLVPVEVHADGRISAWSPGIFGPIGTTGTPTPTTMARIRRPRSVEEKRLLANHVRALNHCMDRQLLLYKTMGGNGFEQETETAMKRLAH